MKVMITGGCGFIGQQLVAQLVAEYGADRVCVLDSFDRGATGRQRVRDLIGDRLVRGSVSQYWRVDGLLRERRPDVCIHVAAQSHVDHSLTAPVETWNTNATGTAIVAHACAAAGVPMVYCGTDEVYGSTPVDGFDRPVPVDESAPLNPSSPYSASKAAGEHAVRAAGVSAGLRWAITRGSNAWGFWQFSEKLIPIACLRVAAGKLVPLHGGGAQLRQWLHVSEFADALHRVAVSLVAGETHGRVFNLAGSEVLSVRAVVRMIARAGGVDSAAQIAPDRPGQDSCYCVDGSSILESLGWRARRRLSDPAELRALFQHYADSSAVPRLAAYSQG